MNGKRWRNIKEESQRKLNGIGIEGYLGPDSGHMGLERQLRQ